MSYNEDHLKKTLSNEKRLYARKESEKLFEKNILERERSKERYYEQRLKYDTLIQKSKEERTNRWILKTKSSPFAVNLVAEDERITEQNYIREKEENENRRALELRKEKAKNEIILKALSEFSDLEALRREKRAILDEELRLKALLNLEKINESSREDRKIAEKNLKRRKELKLELRRKNYRESLDAILEEERQALIRKHNLPLKPRLNTSFNNYSSNSSINSSNSSISF